MNEMFEWQRRVVNEQKELVERMEKLYAFITKNQLFHEMERRDQDDLMEQHQAMVTYNSALQRRISRFK